MKLSPEQIELLRENLLLQLHDTGRVGAQASTLLLGAKAGGFNTLEREDIEEEMEALTNQGLALEKDGQISAVIRIYVITDAGRDLLDRKGSIKRR